MAQDRELDSLKDQQDRAFQRQQDAWQRQNDAWESRQAARSALSQAKDRQQAAYEVQQRAWERRRAAQDDTSRAFDAKNGPHEDQQEAWEELQRLRDRNGPRIGDLRDEHQNMYDCTQQLSRDIDNAFSAGNKDDAFNMIEEVKQLRSDMAELPPQWRELSSEIGNAKEAHVHAQDRFRPLQAEFVRLRDIAKDAKADHEAAQADFKAAQADTREAQVVLDTAKAQHEVLRGEFQEAKRENQRARDMFAGRLDELRAEQEQRKNDRRSFAQNAGVPSEYWDDVWVSIDEEGNVNIYFGGVGEPAGEGHGHYAMNASGYVTYRRDPGEEHGARNFTDYEERRTRPSKGPWTPATSQPPDAGIISGTEGGLNNIVSFKVNQNEQPYDDVLIADGDYSDDKKGFDKNHDHSWYDPETGERGYEDRGKYTGTGDFND